MALQGGVVVLGAGVVGLSTARRLGAAGQKVTVLDSQTPGGVSSRAAAGVAIPSVRLLDDPQMLAFTRAGQKALEADLAQLPEGHLLRRGGGILRIAPDAAMREQLERAAKHAPEWLGTWVDGKALPGLEPALAGTPLLGAYLSEGGFMVDTDAYLNALLSDCARVGVDVRLGEGAVSVQESVDGVEVRTTTSTLQASAVVVAMGAWASALSGLTPLPVRPIRGQMLTLSHPTVRLERIVSGPIYLAPWRGGDIVVGATEEDAGFRNHCTTAGMLQLLAGAARTAPALRDARFVVTWSGLRSATPNGQPLIGPWPETRRIFVGTGHAGQGILTGALTGAALVEWIQSGRSAVAEPFEPSRVLARLPPA